MTREDKQLVAFFEDDAATLIAARLDNTLARSHKHNAESPSVI
jgi:hypothetical protein